MALPPYSGAALDHIKFAFETIKKNPVPWIIINLVFLFVPLVNFLFAIQFCRVVKDCVENDKAPEIGDLFNTEHLGSDVTTIFIAAGCVFLSFLACILPGYFVMVAIAMVMFVTADNKLSGMDAVKAAFYWGKANWIHSFGTLFVIGFITQMSIYACGLGLLIFAPLMHIAHYSWFRGHREAIYETARANGITVA
jgi:uncharacterized membrane protein